LRLHDDVVRDAWVDYNGHLRDAYYLLIFSFATDALLERIGLDDAARRARGRSVYTLEAHVNYLREVKAGARVEIDARVLAHDAKRIHLYLEMFTPGGDGPVAASEQMLLHVDTHGPAAAPFDPDVAVQVAALADAARDASPAAYAGRVIGLPGRRG
jgi:acyl-CoA thioester hydrolase